MMIMETKRGSGVWFRIAMSVCLPLLMAACGSDTPTGPSPLQVGGVWTGTSTIASVQGGECVGTLLLASTGIPAAASLAITQTGSALSATFTSQANGAKCSYTGTAGSANITLNWTQCDIGVVTGIRCANGSLRDMRLTSQSLTASVSGNRMTGTIGESWNVFVSGTGTGVGVLVGSNSISLSR